MVISNAGRSLRARRGSRVNSTPLQFGVVLLSAILPSILYAAYAGEVVARSDNSHNTLLAGALAAAAGLFVYRQVTAYPGTRGFAYILPAFLSTFGIAACILLIGRFAYSGAILTGTFMFTAASMFILHSLGSRGAPLQFYIVPGSESAIISETPRVEWLRLTEPRLPDDPNARLVADLTADHSPEWERLLAQAAISGRAVYHTKQLRESLTGQVQIDHLSENTFGSLLPNHAYVGFKRLLDILVSAAALPLLAVPMLLIAIAIRCETPGAPFFWQRRMGHRGCPFELVKFRTMRVPDPAKTIDPVTRADDERITRVGRFLRRTRLDELPQLWNVLIGQMSLIGPRPEAMQLSEWYEAKLPFYAYRHIVRPGITGWAQINQGHVADLDEVLLKLHYDFYYIKNFSLWIDILIALRTVSIMLSGFGSR